MRFFYVMPKKEVVHNVYSFLSNYSSPKWFKNNFSPNSFIQRGLESDSVFGSSSSSTVNLYNLYGWPYILLAL